MGGAVMGNGTWVGLDVHAKSVVAGLICEGTGELSVMRATHRTEELVRWVGELDPPVRVAYEAGPTGFGLARALEAAGIGCVVAAPSLIARSPAGRNKKNDAHDAEHLARLLRQGELTPVRIPDPADEAARDLVRAREDARADLMRARHRLSKLLLRHGVVYESGRAWTRAHDGWLRRIHLEHPAARAAFDDAYGAVLACALRRETLDGQIAQLATDPRWGDVVGRLGCLRGVGTLTAFALCVEIGDWHRLTGATIGAYLGLTPSESQSGTRHTRGPITKAGNSHARRLLVEAAWHHRAQVRTSAAIERRRAGQRPEVRARAEQAGMRLHHRWYQLERRRGIRSTIVATAVARELAGWCWSLAVMD
jgi:transposase